MLLCAALITAVIIAAGIVIGNAYSTEPRIEAAAQDYLTQAEEYLTACSGDYYANGPDHGNV